MALDIAAIATEEDSKSPKAIVNGDGTASTHYLSRLRSASRPVVADIVDGLETDFGLRSEISAKKDATALEKCSRPETLRKYPWFTLAHIRDYLRFRTHLSETADFERVLDRFVHLQDRGVIGIIKVDVEKLVRPGAFGWRMIATDIRIGGTDLIVEHYMTFGDMIAINEAWLHKVYEAWRTKARDSMAIRELEEFDRDALFSRHAYRELLFDGILRNQPTGSTLPARRRATRSAILTSLKKELSLP